MTDKVAKMLVVGASIFLLLIGFCLYIVFDRQGYSNSNKGTFISYKVDDYVEVTPMVYNNYSDVYSSINVSKVNIKNINNANVQDFFNNQDEIINYIDGYYDDIKTNIDSSYLPINTVYSDIKTQINGTILSIFYELSFNLDDDYFEDNNRNYITTVNIDLGTDRVLTNDDLLSKYNYTKKYISEKIFEEDIMIPKGQMVIDKHTNISLTSSDIERKKEEYVNRIIDEFDNIINIYVENHSLALVYDKKVLKNVFFDNDFDTYIEIKYLK